MGIDTEMVSTLTRMASSIQPVSHLETEYDEEMIRSSNNFLIFLDKPRKQL